MVVVSTGGPGRPVGFVAGLAASRWPGRSRPRACRRAAEVVRAATARGPIGRLVRRRLDPTRLTGPGPDRRPRRAHRRPASGSACCCAWCAPTAASPGGTSSFARFGAEHATAWTTDVLRNVSRLGGYELSWSCIAVVVAAVEVRRLRRLGGRRPSSPWWSAGQFAVAEPVKHVVDRARPDLLNLTGFSGTSFPSGHATAAAATFMAHAPSLLGRGRRPTTRAVLVGVAAGIAAGGGRHPGAARRALVHRRAGRAAARAGRGSRCARSPSAALLLRFGAPVVQAEAVADAAAEPARRRGVGGLASCFAG